MTRRLIVFNTILGILCLALGLGTGRALLLRRPLPEPTGWRASSASSPSALSGPGQTSGAEHGAIIAKNVFNPSRSEAGGVTPVAARPYLHGVVVDGTRSRAFLEEPLARRVRGYSVGGAGRRSTFTISAVKPSRTALAPTGGGLLPAVSRSIRAPGARARARSARE